MVREASHAGRTGKDVLVAGRPTLREKNEKKNPYDDELCIYSMRKKGPVRRSTGSEFSKT